jgi:hypothetical protein
MSSSIKVDRSPNQRITGITCTPIILDCVPDPPNYRDCMNVIPRHTCVTIIVHANGSDSSKRDMAEVSAISAALQLSRRFSVDQLPPEERTTPT